LIKIIFFFIATLGFVWISRASLHNFKHHGFFRFLSWETILILFLINVEYWFVDLFSLWQITSWSFLILSLVLIYQGVQLFRKTGGIEGNRHDPQLLGVEKTTELVTTGVYHYIRHPFYSSLLFLGWGIFFKHISWIGLILAGMNTIFLVVTAKREESENIEYFGEEYRHYMNRTKMFIPYLF
jgi:protein-S-isoprenylcysteine O-methyltransferase Ste14